MAQAPRTIHLRRPPVLAMQEGVFVPDVDRGTLEGAERRWRSICDANPASFDGRVCHVLGVHRNGHGGATIHAIDCAYRFAAVQDHDLDLGVRAMGAKGLVIHKDQILTGRRSHRVCAYRELWEFIPGGIVEPGSDPARLIERELLEETGLTPRTPPRAVAILYDASARTWEIVYVIIPTMCDTMPSTEHDRIAWRSIDSIGNWLVGASEVTRTLTTVLNRALLRTLPDSGEQPSDQPGRIVR